MGVKKKTGFSSTWHMVGTLVVMYAITAHYSTAQAGSTSNESAEDDHCEKVPQISKPKDDGKQLDLMYLVTQGENFLENYTATKDAILVLGNTGSGKSTLTQILAGDLSRLHAVEAPGDRLVIIDQDDRIGVPSTESKTLVPEQVLKTKNESEILAFYDCPGFADTRGPTQDIAANFFMNMVTTKIQNVKMLFLATHSSVKTGNDRIDFDTLAKHATTFVKSFEKFQHSFALVITKVDNFNSRGRYISNKKIIDEIVDFLKNYNQTLYSKLASNQHNDREIITKKIFFVETLLEQNPKGNYRKIWFVRSPIDCGPLSESETVQETKKTITKLYEELVFAKVDTERDFSFTIKDHSTAYIANLTKSINKEIAQAVSQSIEDLIQWHLSTKIQPKVKDSMIAPALNEFKRIVNEINGIYKELEPKNPKIDLFTKTLKKIWIAFEEPLPPKLEMFLERKGEYLNFLSRVSQANQIPANGDWYQPILGLKKLYNDKRDWFDFLTNLQIYVSSYDFQYRFPKPSQVMNSNLWLDYIEKNSKLVTAYIKEISFRTSRTYLQILDKLMKFSTEGIKVYCKGAATIIQANFVAISNFANLMKKCSFGKSQLYVYVAHTIFFDEQVTLFDVDVVLIAPYFNNPNSKLEFLELQGTSGSSIMPRRAFDGENGKSWSGSDKNGKNGNAGRAGLPGSPGGAIFSIVESADPVKFISKGGRGGDAQNGGNGGHSKTGNVPCSQEPDSSGHEPEFFPCGSRTCRRNKKTSEHSGSDGGNGGNGGNGGVGGFGGINSKILIINFTRKSKIQTENSNGQNGNPGNGGNKGIGSPKAKGYKKRGDSCKSLEAKKKRDGSNGSDGTPNSSRLELRYPSTGRQIDDWPHVIYYKTCFLNYTHYKTANFIEQLDKNTQMDIYFNLKFLAEETLAIEELNTGTINPDRMEKILKSLIFKLEKYSHKNFRESSREHQKVLSMLLTSCYSSLIRVRIPSRLPVIVDLAQYFQIVYKQIESLKTAAAYSATLGAKTEFTNEISTKIRQATYLINSTVASAINQAGEDIDFQLKTKQKELTEQIQNNMLTLSEYKAKLQRDEPFKNLLTIVTTFGFLSDLASPYAPVKGFSTFSTIARKLQVQFAGLPRETERVNALLKEGEQQLLTNQEKQQMFTKIIPHVASALMFWKNISESIITSGYISAPNLKVNKFQIINKLKDCKHYLEELSDNALNLKSLVTAFDRLQDAITLSIELYEMIERYQELISLAGYIEKVNSAALEPEPIRDPVLARTVASFDKTVRTNLLSLEVQKVTHAFRQWVFPFAKMYFLQELKLPAGVKLEIGDEQLRQVEHLQRELQKYKASIVANHDEFIVQTNFSSDLKTSKPFFTWENAKWRKEIEALFSGSKVYLDADIRLGGIKTWDAIKFKQIEINFKLDNATQEMQTEFDEIIEYFGIVMTHSGISYYRFVDDYFVMTGQNQTIQYNFEKDTSGNRLGANQVYEKFKRGDFMLSPYTLWTVKLQNAVPSRKLTKQKKVVRHDISFNLFKNFLPHINVELVGIGTYVKGQEALRAIGGDLELDKWYQRENRLKLKHDF